jgi:hypothetical protein
MERLRHTHFVDNELLELDRGCDARKQLELLYGLLLNVSTLELCGSSKQDSPKMVLLQAMMIAEAMIMAPIGSICGYEGGVLALGSRNI